MQVCMYDSGHVFGHANNFHTMLIAGKHNWANIDVFRQFYRCHIGDLESTDQATDGAEEASGVGKHCGMITPSARFEVWSV